MLSVPWTLRVVREWESAIRTSAGSDMSTERALTFCFSDCLAARSSAFASSSGFWRLARIVISAPVEYEKIC